MSKFTDTTGKEWSVSLDVSAIKRVKKSLEVDLLDVAEARVFEQLMGDPITLVDVLYVVCQPQAEAAEISDEQFGAAMGGETIEQATEALINAVIDFFPTQRRQVLKHALTKVKAIETRVCERAMTILDGPELEQKIEAALSTIGEQSTNSPESSESIPAR